MEFSTRAIHVGNEPDPETGAVVPPIHRTTTYRQKTPGVWEAFDYSRTANPTRSNLEKTIANLEGGTGALAYSSGMAAITGAATLARNGENIVADKEVYGGTYRLFQKVLGRWGIGARQADAGDPEALEAAMDDKTKMLWIESPTNPLLSIRDIRLCAEIAHKRGALLAVDSSFASPVLTRPLELGADIVVQSMTKYYGGHSDVLAGAVAVRDQALWEELHYLQNATGAVLGPDDSYLIARSIKTLEVRVRRQSRTALKLAQVLQEDPRIGRVYYPGLPEHPGHGIAQEQMEGGFGGMLSFEVEDGEIAKRICQTTKLFTLAVSLGAAESLIEHPATMSHATFSQVDREQAGIRDGLIRLSVGLEAFKDLRGDLRGALKQAHGRTAKGAPSLTVPVRAAEA